MKKIIFFCFFFQTLLAFGQTNIDIPSNVQQWLNLEINKSNKKVQIKPLKEKDSKVSTKNDNSNVLQLPQLPQLQNEVYVDDFFNEKPAYLIGYIKNYNEVSKSFFLRLMSEDVLSGQAGFPLSINIMPDGRFTVKIPNPHPQYSYLWFGDDEGFPFYIEPDQTLGMIIDWKSKNNKIEFQGKLAQINNNLTAVSSNITELNPYFIYGKGSEMSPQEFSEEYTRQYKNTQNEINEYLAKNPLASKAGELAKFNNMIMYSSKMLEYAFKKSQSVQIPSTFYSFLNELPLDNPQLLAGSQSNSMVLRLYDILESKMRNCYLSTTHVTEPDYSGVSNVKLSAYKELLEELAMKESLLKDSFQVRNSLLTDILKLHIFSNQLSLLSNEEKELFSAAIKAQIKHPFLKRQVEKLKVLDAVNAANKIFELPKGETLDFFNEIIAKHKGKYLLVDFWGTNCGFCVEDMRNTFSIREKYENSPKIDFIFITDYSWSPKELYDKFVDEQHLQFTYRLQTQLYDAFCNDFMFNGIPHYVLIDQSGKIISKDYALYRIAPESAIECILIKK